MPMCCYICWTIWWYRMQMLGFVELYMCVCVCYSDSCSLFFQCNSNTNNKNSLSELSAADLTNSCASNFSVSTLCVAIVNKTVHYTVLQWQFTVLCLPFFCLDIPIFFNVCYCYYYYLLVKMSVIRTCFFYIYTGFIYFYILYVLFHLPLSLSDTSCGLVIYNTPAKNDFIKWIYSQRSNREQCVFGSFIFFFGRCLYMYMCVFFHSTKLTARFFDLIAVFFLLLFYLLLFFIFTFTLDLRMFIHMLCSQIIESNVFRYTFCSI